MAVEERAWDSAWSVMAGLLIRKPAPLAAFPGDKESGGRPGLHRRALAAAGAKRRTAEAAPFCLAMQSRTARGPAAENGDAVAVAGPGGLRSVSPLLEGRKARL